ncbi:unnamed protein product [Cutaneotrichosporon oleaginosum]
MAGSHSTATFNWTNLFTGFAVASLPPPPRWHRNEQATHHTKVGQTEAQRIASEPTPIQVEPKPKPKPKPPPAAPDFGMRWHVCALCIREAWLQTCPTRAIFDKPPCRSGQPTPSPFMPFRPYIHPRRSQSSDDCDMRQRLSPISVIRDLTSPILACRLHSPGSRAIQPRPDL